jgi:hypothetical protein
MKKEHSFPIDLANAKLRAWRKKHDAPAKVAAAHRRVLLNRVVASMAFDGQPVSMARLKILLKYRKATGK